MEDLINWFLKFKFYKRSVLNQINIENFKSEFKKYILSLLNILCKMKSLMILTVAVHKDLKFIGWKKKYFTQ